MLWREKCHKVPCTNQLHYMLFIQATSNCQGPAMCQHWPQLWGYGSDQWQRTLLPTPIPTLLGLKPPPVPWFPFPVASYYPTFSIFSWLQPTLHLPLVDIFHAQISSTLKKSKKEKKKEKAPCLGHCHTIKMSNTHALWPHNSMLGTCSTEIPVHIYT